MHKIEKYDCLNKVNCSANLDTAKWHIALSYCYYRKKSFEIEKAKMFTWN